MHDTVEPLPNVPPAKDVARSTQFRVSELSLTLDETLIDNRLRESTERNSLDAICHSADFQHVDAGGRMLLDVCLSS